MINLTAMFPVLVVENLAAQKHFYETQFGFITEFHDENFYLHLLHAGSGTQLAFMLPEHPSQPEFLHKPVAHEGMVISFEVSSCKEAYDAAVAAELPIVLDYLVEEFGVTHFMVRDPAGMIIDIVEHHAQPDS